MALDISDPKIVTPDQIEPHYNWDRAIPAPGHTGVDFEERVNFRRLHDYRLGRTRMALTSSPSTNSVRAIVPSADRNSCWSSSTWPGPNSSWRPSSSAR